METVGSIKEELSKYPDEMEVIFWASPTEKLYLASLYPGDKVKHKPIHLNIDMEFE